MVNLIIKWFSLLLLLVVAGAVSVQAQDKPSGKTLAATMNIYVFPKQSQAATQQQIDDFKKAFSVCLEAKDYLVKY